MQDQIFPLKKFPPPKIIFPSQISPSFCFLSIMRTRPLFREPSLYAKIIFSFQDLSTPPNPSRPLLKEDNWFAPFFKSCVISPQLICVSSPSRNPTTFSLPCLALQRPLPDASRVSHSNPPSNSPIVTSRVFSGVC